MGSAQKSMMKSIFVLGYDCNKMFRYHFTQRLLMISTIVVLTALHTYHFAQQLLMINIMVLIIGWEVHCYKSMMESIFTLDSDCITILRYHFAQQLLMISTIAQMWLSLDGKCTITNQ